MTEQFELTKRILSMVFGSLGIACLFLQMRIDLKKYAELYKSKYLESYITQEIINKRKAFTFNIAIKLVMLIAIFLTILIANLKLNGHF